MADSKTEGIFSIDAAAINKLVADAQKFLDHIAVNGFDATGAVNGQPIQLHFTIGKT
jgi:hypothetical protein